MQAAEVQSAIQNQAPEVAEVGVPQVVLLQEHAVTVVFKVTLYNPAALAAKQWH